MCNKKEFKLTEEFIENGAIHCNTEEEYKDMIKWFGDNDIELDANCENIEWNYKNIYITIYNSEFLWISAYSYNDNSCGYYIIEWTNYISKDINPKEIENKTEENKEITFEDINIKTRGYELNAGKTYVDKYIKDNTPTLLYIHDRSLPYSEIPDFIRWLQDVYTYGQQILKYTDFNSALEWMKQGNKAKLGKYTYYIENNNFKVKECSQEDIELRLHQVDSKEWILLNK